MIAPTDVEPDSPVTAKMVGSRRISHWFEVTQNQIDAFAEATGDQQGIHQANVKKGHRLFGGPIAHGLLLVSIALNLAQESSALPPGDWVLYGFDKLRFRSPVRSGTHIRCLTTIFDLQELGGRLLLSVRLAVETLAFEIEDRKAPALIADCSLLCFKEKVGR
jgi:acyl dehydratase